MVFCHRFAGDYLLCLRYLFWWWRNTPHPTSTNAPLGCTVWREGVLGVYFAHKGEKWAIFEILGLFVHWSDREQLPFSPPFGFSNFMARSDDGAILASSALT